MKRREFMGLLIGGAAVSPFAVHAQQRPTQHRIAIFHPAIPANLITETGGGTAWRAFFGELRRLGYIEGENLIVERYSAEGHTIVMSLWRRISSAAARMSSSPALIPS